MQKFFSILARLFAVLLAVLFIVTLAAALILVNAEDKLFKSETYKQALDNTDMYSRLPALVAQQAFAGPNSGSGGQTFLANLTLKDWETLISTLVPPTEARQVTEQTLDQVFDYLNGKSETAVISLQPIKTSLQQNGVQAFEQFLATQPECSVTQLAELLVEFSDPSQAQGKTWCKPPPDTIDVLTPLINALLQENIAAMPDQTTLLRKEDGANILPQIDFARLIARLSPLLPLVLLLLMSLLVVRSFKGWLRWWGIPLLIGGAISLIIGIIGAPLVAYLLTTQITFNPEIVTTWVRLLLDVILAVVRQVAFPVVLESLGIMLVAGIMVLATSMGKRQSANEPNTQP